MNRLTLILLKKTLVMAANLINPESTADIISLTKRTCIVIKLLVQLLLRVQNKNWDKWNVCVFGSFNLFALCVIGISIIKA